MAATQADLRMHANQIERYGREGYCGDSGLLAKTADRLDALEAVLAPLVQIADAYDLNKLDDGARKRWGAMQEYLNERPPAQIELYSGRGGKCLLTLADCFAARAAIRGE